MAGASFEVTLELWAASLREAKARMRPLFLQERMARSTRPGNTRTHAGPPAREAQIP